MIHTAQIFSYLTQVEFDKISRLENTATATTKNITTITTTALAKQGVRKITAYQIKHKSGNVCYCELVFNLNRVYQLGKQTPKPFIVNKDSKKQLKTNFLKIISPLLPNKADLSKWHTQRIDYTIDIQTPLVGKYIQLFQRGDKPYRSVIDNDKQHKSEKDKTHYKNQVRYKNKSCTIQIYDKYQERLTLKHYPKEQLAQCKNILRVELQCKHNKVSAIKKRFELPNKKFLSYLLNEQQQEKLFTSYLTAICGKSTYYSLTKAKQIINKSQLRLVTKQELIHLLENVNSSKSVWKAKANYNKTTFRRLKETIDKLNINLVTIPKRWKNEQITDIFHLRE